MKNLIKLISCIFAIIVLFSCNKTKNYKELIIGKWQIDSLFSYYKGEERMFKPGNDEHLIIGTWYNPRFWEFNKYNEKRDYRLNYKEEKSIFSYEIIGDTIIFSNSQSNNKSKWVIVNLTDTNLVLESNATYVKGDSKTINRFYFTKRKKLSNDKLIIGNWKIKNIFSCMYEYDKFGNPELTDTSSMKDISINYTFTKDNYKMVNKGKTYLNQSYKISEDSLITKGYPFFIQKLNEKEFILSVDGTESAFGKNSSTILITKIVGEKMK